ncbi:hypothetical protein [Aquimarina algiphila]|uniref:hypothetical protein n=1 Tax=Aquimarina algiphila TaxID=2047982 RepID=UPI00232D9C7B|nr:hypothetical protein [Aquimarina algiphila]
MLKKILDLNGVNKLSNDQLKFVKGGLACDMENPCPGNTYCDYRWGDVGLCV